MSNKQLVLDYCAAWREQKQELLKLADDLYHISPNSTFTSRESFLDACWEQFSPYDIQIEDIVEEGDTVCFWYKFPKEQGEGAITEWHKIENGLIKEIRVFY